MLGKCRVIIVSGSNKLISFISRGLATDSSISVVGVNSVLSAKSSLMLHMPNVIILDTNGQTSATQPFLKQLMEKHNLLVLLVVTDISDGRAYSKLNIRSVHIQPKNLELSPINHYFNNDIMEKIKSFYATSSAFSHRNMLSTVDNNQQIIVLASSTGGTEAVYSILSKLPADIPPMLIVQHMPANFTRLFADRLNKNCPMRVEEAGDGMYLQKGLVLIAPGDYHMRLVKRNSRLLVEIFTGDKVNGVRPAADLLFYSVAPLMGANAIGVILTGMGIDGAKGLLEMRAKGALTIGQDEGSSIVYGMPKAAFNMGAVMKQASLDNIPKEIMALVKK